MGGEKQKLFSLAAIVVAAVLFGMVLASGLDFTPRVDANRQEDLAVAQKSDPPAVVNGTPDFAVLAEQVVPSVVSVFSTDLVQPQERRRSMPLDPFHFFFGPRQDQEGQQEIQRRESSGSGFFISAKGEVITNNHVVEDADELEIELADGSTYEMKVVGRDPATDIALLQVVESDSDFPYLNLGDSQSLRVGEWVMAVGNPLRLDHTVTVGVVSAKGRTLGLGEDSSFENFIQTDAAINLGNSGGPLVNVRGEVVGINTAINVRGQNLGFAVPVNVARRILPQLRESGKVVRGYLGVIVREVDERFKDAFGLPSREGALVDEVVPGRAADKAGLKHGDVVVSVNGKAIKNTRELIDMISAMPPGAKVELGVIRNGDAKKIDVILDERDTTVDDSAVSGDEDRDGDVVDSRVGIEARDLSARLRQYYRIEESVDGVVVTHVRSVSPAGEEGVREGDVIVEANGREISSRSDLVDEVEKVDAGGYLRLYLHRPLAERSFHVILELE